ncbi:hypothetical protein ACFL9T_18660 [Thermodesulfobacteriota bacterium]
MGKPGKMMMTKKKLLGGLPYSEEELNDLRMPDIKMLGSALGVDTWQKKKAEIINGILSAQDDLEPTDERIDDFFFCHVSTPRAEPNILISGILKSFSSSSE